MVDPLPFTITSETIGGLHAHVYETTLVDIRILVNGLFNGHASFLSNALDRLDRESFPVRPCNVSKDDRARFSDFSATRVLAQPQDHFVRRSQGSGRHQRTDAAAQRHAAVEPVFAVQRGRGVAGNHARGRGQVAGLVSRAKTGVGGPTTVAERPFMIAVGLGKR